MLTKAFRIDINPSVKHNPDIRNELKGMRQQIRNEKMSTGEPELLNKKVFHQKLRKDASTISG